MTIKGVTYAYETIKRLYGALGTHERLGAMLNCTKGNIEYWRQNDPKFRLGMDLG
jgi:hypothetical protein